jgi:hypothetical protein
MVPALLKYKKVGNPVTSSPADFKNISVYFLVKNSHYYQFSSKNFSLSKTPHIYVRKMWRPCKINNLRNAALETFTIFNHSSQLVYQNATLLSNTFYHITIVSKSVGFVNFLSLN